MTDNQTSFTQSLSTEQGDTIDLYVGPDGVRLTITDAPGKGFAQYGTDSKLTLTETKLLETFLSFASQTHHHLVDDDEEHPAHVSSPLTQAIRQMMTGQGPATVAVDVEGDTPQGGAYL